MLSVTDYIAFLESRDRIEALKANVATATCTDLVMMLKLDQTSVAPELVTGPVLDGARVLSFASVGAMLSSMDADQAHVVDYLRLYAFVHDMGALRQFPAKTAVTQSTKATTDEIGQLQMHGLTEEMMMHMDPEIAFSGALGVKASVLQNVKEEIVSRRRSKSFGW